jgi:hypothetical protein
VFIHTELLLEKSSDLGLEPELIEVPFVFNTEYIVTARPALDDADTPEHMRRHSVISMTDGSTYMIKHQYAEVITWIDPASPDGNVLNTYPTKPTLDVSN